MNKELIISAFVHLAQRFSELTSGSMNEENPRKSNWQQTITKARIANGWFDEEMVKKSLEAWTIALQPQKIEQWLNRYDLKVLDAEKQKSVGLILAGNIPLVGLHDVLCLIASGHKGIIKMATDDSVLLPFVLDILSEKIPDVKERLQFTGGLMKNADAFIATGSNNSARYFDYYFSGKPNIIRKSRFSWAILNGDESDIDLELLMDDIFLYYGLGCRSVSKLFLPHDYPIDNIFRHSLKYLSLYENKKYSNNYDYHRAIYLLNRDEFYDNNFMLLKPDKANSSPVSVLFFERYSSSEEMEARVKEHTNEIQCIAAKNNWNVPSRVDFGTTQFPSLSDYADGIDTMEFLLSL
jgi:hypothetical protein